MTTKFVTLISAYTHKVITEYNNNTFAQPQFFFQHVVQLKHSIYECAQITSKIA